MKEAKAEILAEAKSTIQKRVSNVFKGFRESESKPTTVAEDTRNFVRKRRTQRIETVEEVDVKKDDEDESVNKHIKIIGGGHKNLFEINFEGNDIGKIIWDFFSK